MFKILGLFILFSLVKAIVPRYRFDQLMRLGWKIFLPLSLIWLVLTAILNPVKKSFINKVLIILLIFIILLSVTCLKKIKNLLLKQPKLKRGAEKFSNLISLIDQNDILELWL